MYLNAMLSIRECCSFPSERFVIIFHPILLQDSYTKLINISAVLQYINIITSTKFLILISVPILQGVPQLSIHFVLVVFSASRALTEKYFTIF